MCLMAATVQVDLLACSGNWAAAPNYVADAGLVKAVFVVAGQAVKASEKLANWKR
jgi:hypothetical protein